MSPCAPDGCPGLGASTASDAEHRLALLSCPAIHSSVVGCCPLLSRDKSGPNASPVSPGFLRGRRLAKRGESTSW
ncbi:hypothetical protein J6590_004383 [Homalodisca vitripennis]|nr:hypothetical protein J6590_004383 [Homalodisca vitripennis]